VKDIEYMSGKLAIEIKTFEENRAELEKAHPDKFVLIRGDKIIDTFDSFENAAEEAVRLFAREDFLIREIGADEPKLSPAIFLGLNTDANLAGRIRRFKEEAVAS
jgi:hypothetical protein